MEGTTTTPFDMAVRNDLDRFHLVADAIEVDGGRRLVRPERAGRMEDA